MLCKNCAQPLYVEHLYEKSLADDEIRWAQDARCCVGITVDLSVATGPEGIRATDLTTPGAEFGANQGLLALLAVLNRHSPDSP